MSEWQPIETAPREGQLVLAFGPDHGPPGWADASAWYCLVRYEGELWLTDEAMDVVAPTHWMPLPEPPHA